MEELQQDNNEGLKYKLIMIRLIIVLWLLLSVFRPTVAAADVADINTCAVHLLLPSYPLLARQARLSGTVALTVEIGRMGKVKNITASKIHKLLEAASRSAVSSSEFKPQCEGKTVALTFTFVLEPPSKGGTSEQVIFYPPSAFNIRSSYFNLQVDR